MKTSLRNVILLNLFMLCARGGEVEQFIRETLEEQRARSECEPNEVAQIVGDAINDSKLPEFELPKESIFTSKDKENDARYYSYDKSGKLISVEYAARPEKNEYYAYDKQGNILEKRIGNSIYKYTYDTANQLMEMESPEGKREYFYDRAGRLVSEKLNGKIDVEYKYGYLDKVIEVNRNGKITKFAYDGFGMLAQKTFHDGTTEVWVWDGLALIRRGSDIYVNEPHISGGVPILSKTDEGVRYHEHDFLGTTLWSTDTNGNLVKDYQDTTIFGEGSIQKDRSARFTGKPYDEDLQAYVFPYRNYDASTARWRSSDPAGYPDGINNQFYAAVPTYALDPLGLEFLYAANDTRVVGIINKISQTNYGKDPNSAFARIQNDPNAKVIVISDENFSSFNPSDRYYYDMPVIRISDSDTINNSNYVLSDGNGGVTTGNVSIESIFIHEGQHAYDWIYNNDTYDTNVSTNGENGGSILEDRAMAEANKYRKEMNEPERKWYRDIDDYNNHYER